jgi:hypothetical protein
MKRQPTVAALPIGSSKNKVANFTCDSGSQNYGSFQISHFHSPNFLLLLNKKQLRKCEYTAPAIAGISPEHLLFLSPEKADKKRPRGVAQH